MNPTTYLLLLLIAAAPAHAQNSPDLPPPYATKSAANPPKVIARPDGAQLQVPAGFTVEEYASGFQKPRFMALGPGGAVLVADSVPGGKVVLLTANGKERKVLLDGLDRPYGLAFWKDFLYVAETTSVKRYRYDPKAMAAVTPGQEVVPMKDFGKGHWTRSILFDRKGAKFYLGVGSSSNQNPGDPEMRAAISRFNPDGSGREIVASGLRNPIGIHWRPGTDELWAAVQERDGLGDDLVPDYFTKVQPGAFYGWPYAYIGPHEDPVNKGQRPDLVSKTLVPDVLLQPSHVAVLDYAFYTGNMFPAEYRGGAFLAYHGTSNRSKRAGYSVAFLPFQNGKPREQREFLTGWMKDPDSPEVWGRPVAVLELPDGSLLVSDDGGNRIWRVSYGK